jgi:hypothetical protein
MWTLELMLCQDYVVFWIFIVNLMYSQCRYVCSVSYSRYSIWDVITFVICFRIATFWAVRWIPRARTTMSVAKVIYLAWMWLLCSFLWGSFPSSIGKAIYLAWIWLLCSFIWWIRCTCISCIHSICYSSINACCDSEWIFLCIDERLYTRVFSGS